MKQLVSGFVLLCLSVTLSASASAQFSITVAADSTIAGNPGKVLRATDLEIAEEIAVFEESGLLRVYAERIVGEAWAPDATAVYFVRVSSMNIGDTWNFPTNDDDEAQTAEVVAIESVSVMAGTYANAYRVDVKLATAGPSDPIAESVWFVENVGNVLNVGYRADGSEQSREELASYTGTGTGFFPLNLGNVWTYEIQEFVPNESTGFGELKARY